MNDKRMILLQTKIITKVTLKGKVTVHVTHVTTLNSQWENMLGQIENLGKYQFKVLD